MTHQERTAKEATSHGALNVLVQGSMDTFASLAHFSLELASSCKRKQVQSCPSITATLRRVRSRQRCSLQSRIQRSEGNSAVLCLAQRQRSGQRGQTRFRMNRSQGEANLVLFSPFFPCRS